VIHLAAAAFHHLIMVLIQVIHLVIHLVIYLVITQTQ